jgi:hypothetical protein
VRARDFGHHDRHAAGHRFERGDRESVRGGQRDDHVRQTVVIGHPGVVDGGHPANTPFDAVFADCRLELGNVLRARLRLDQEQHDILWEERQRGHRDFVAV